MQTRRRVSSMPRLALLMTILCVSVLNAATPTSAQTSSCGPRVRKAWGMLSTPDKQLYLDAVMAAMANGNHALFLEVHGDTASGNEGHRTCGMLYWHRRFILAYENMLRSLDPRFECVTIPYWDYYTDYTKKLAVQCTSFESCSRILTDFGAGAGSYGNPTAATTFTYDGVTPLSGSCVVGSGVSAAMGLATNFSLANFCHNSTLANCSGCIPRDNWGTKAFPSGFGLVTLAKYISGSFGFANFAQNLHYGVHNSIHNTAGSTMATLFTAADPIFYNHHSTIDLLHQWWYDCQVQRPMTETEKKTSNYAFQQCSLSATDICPTSTSNITQFWPNSSWGANPERMRVEDHPVLGPFFSPLPTQYWQYVSGTDLGDYSYTYERDSLLAAFSLANVSISCPLVSKARRLSGITTTSFTTTTSTVTTTPMQTSINLFVDLVNTSLSTVSTLGPALSATDAKNEALDQIELMHCSWYELQEGTVDDYTTYFRANFKYPTTAHTLCYNRMQQLRSGQKTILVPGWYDIYENHLTNFTGNGQVNAGTARR